MEHFSIEELKIMGVAYYRMTSGRNLTEEQNELLRKLNKLGWKNLSKDEKAVFWMELIRYEKTQIPTVRTTKKPEQKE